MGRRAKNKQPAPKPLEPAPSNKKLGKRKAEVDKDDVQRPIKKIKDLNGKSRGKSTTNLKTVRRSDHRNRQKENELESDGWEDVEDVGGLKTHSKLVDHFKICRRC